MRLKKRINNKKTALLLMESFRKSGMTQSVLSGIVGIKQPQISRVLNGKFQRASKSFNALCAYFKVNPIARKKMVKLQDYPELTSCLDEVLDGSRRREQAIIRLLKSAKNLA